MDASSLDVMRGLRSLACGVAVIASVGTSAASAANWDPPGTERVATSNNLLLSMGDLTFQCTHVAMTVRLAGSDVAATTPGVANPVSFANCDSSIGTMTVATAGTWVLTATSTTVVDLTATGTGAGGTGAVMTMNLDPQPNCTIFVDGPQTIPGNAWSNTTHRLFLNSTATFTQTPVGAGCLGRFPGLLKLVGTFTLPSDVTVT